MQKKTLKKTPVRDNNGNSLTHYTSIITVVVIITAIIHRQTEGQRENDGRCLDSDSTRQRGEGSLPKHFTVPYTNGDIVSRRRKLFHLGEL